MCAEKFHKLGHHITEDFKQVLFSSEGLILIVFPLCCMLLFLWCLLLDFASSTKIPESISHFWKPTLSSCPLFILLAFARSAWLPGVRKYHNYLINICPGLPANQVSIAENSKKENRNLLRRNKLVFRHRSRKLPRNKSLSAWWNRRSCRFMWSV